jgi:hypothetical protein
MFATEILRKEHDAMKRIRKPPGNAGQKRPEFIPNSFASTS